jgi:hypothetical protein
MSSITKELLDAFPELIVKLRGSVDIKVSREDWPDEMSPNVVALPSTGQRQHDDLLASGIQRIW